MLSHASLHLWLKRLVRILLILLLILVIATISGVAFVEIRRHQALILPAPTGSYAVGRMEYDWTDQERTDPLAPHAGMKRELVVWAWYPARRVSGAEVAPYLPPKWAQLSDQQHGFLGQQLIQSSDSIQAHSFDNAPLATASARYPVLIFEPGLGNIPTQYTTLLEDLASHGYIIFAITPTYSSDVVVFPNGREALATPAGQLPETSTNLQTAGNQLVTVWAQDVIFVMNQLDRLNATPGTMWSQRLDLARLGVFGHSLGGATAALVCQMDARCKAGIDLDGDLFGDVVQTGLDKPFMVIQSDPGSCSNSDCRSFQHEVQAILRTVPRGASYHLGIKGTEHFNFSDYAVYFSPARVLGLLGSIDGVRGLQITRTYVRAFFDTYLNKTPSPLLRGPASTYPEVQFFTP
jgi:predicted dienelactone hydrolase